MDDNTPWPLEMWRCSGTLVHISWILLFGMFLWTALQAAEKGLRYLAAIWQTRKFVRTSATLLETGNWQDALSLAEKKKWSHVARVIACGLREYFRALPLMSQARAADVAQRESRVAANRFREKLREGQSTLGSIATTSPLLALFGTTVGIFDAFPGYSGSRYGYLVIVTTRIAIALSTTAGGLIVAVIAVWCFNWWDERYSMLDAEMRIASLELRKRLEN